MISRLIGNWVDSYSAELNLIKLVMNLIEHKYKHQPYSCMKNKICGTSSAP